MNSTQASSQERLIGQLLMTVIIRMATGWDIPRALPLSLPKYMNCPDLEDEERKEPAEIS
jgi:hypothetical protein